MRFFVWILKWIGGVEVFMHRVVIGRRRRR